MEAASLSRPNTVLGPLSTRAEWLPLIPRQCLLWADEQILAQPRYHHWVLWVRFDGELDVTRFEKAWEDTAKSHDALALVVDNRAPRQRFAVGLPTLRTLDLSEGISIEHWVGEQSTREFATSRQPWDAVLVRGANGEVAFVFRAHYLVCDERSFCIVASEVNARYLGERVAQSGPFREQISLHANPQNLDDSSDTRAMWEQLLADPPPPAVPLGCIRANEGISIARVARWFSASMRLQLAERMAEEVLRHEDPEESYQLLVAVITIAWLYCTSGQSDLVISTSLDQRLESSRNTVGVLSNKYYLRVKIDNCETFATLALKVRSGFEFMRDNSSATLGDPGCSSAHVGVVPVWPSTFCGHPAHFRLGNAPVFAELGLGQGDGRNDLAVRLVREGNSLGLLFDLGRSVYGESERERLVSYFFNLVQAFLDNPQASLDTAPWMSSSEQADLRRFGVGPQPPDAPDLLARFSHWVSATPEKVAVEWGGKGLSYSELDRLSNRLARRLLSLGVERESRVAVALQRSFSEHIALLATLKAQCAYVPVDPNHPVERIRLILEDANPDVLIAPSTSPLIAAVPPSTRVCRVDDAAVEDGQFDEDTLGEVVVSPGQLAYILFTSGSTGRPKGVAVTRDAFANFLQSMAREPGLSSIDRVLAITTTTFDIAGLELFLPLYVGATVVLVDKDTAVDPVQLRATLERDNLSLMQATPATWRLLLDAGWTGHQKLRMLCGGEAMSLALARRLAACGAELWNVYGPTETTVWSTLDLVSPDVERVTIGHAIDHTRITLRYADGRLVALGAVGEICIAGRGLARGYYGRDDLTAASFRFDSASGERYYRTGDLGRFLPDGRLECLGRVDHQVKVRGYRIELSDIESQLRGVPGVAEVVVVAENSGDGDPQLKAYWVGSASRDELIAAAKATLPSYMVPSAYVSLDALPLTTSGKLDRKRLPRDSGARQVMVGAIAPRNDRESIVAAAFREVLDLPFVPVNEDFFALGGTSIRAVRLRSRIEALLGISVPMRFLFEHPTIEGIVARLDDVPHPDDPVVVWTRRGATRLPWIGIEGIHLFEDIARSLPTDQSFLGMHIPARYVPGVDPFPSIVELARKYVTELRRHHPAGPYFLLGLCHGGVVAFEVAAQLEGLGAHVGAVALLDAELPSARRIQHGVKLRSFLRDLLVDPEKANRQAMIALGNAIRGNFTANPGKLIGAPCNEAIDMPFDGPEIDQELLAYQDLARRTMAQVVTFRATKSDHPPWVQIDSDLGWSAKASRVVSYDIGSSHLGIVRGDAAVEVARILDDVKRGLGH